jgi:hypothetical protein
MVQPQPYSWVNPRHDTDTAGLILAAAWYRHKHTAGLSRAAAWYRHKHTTGLIRGMVQTQAYSWVNPRHGTDTHIQLG